MATKAQEKRDQAMRYAEYLKEYLPVGSTVYTVVMHVSASGMSRTIKTLAAIPNGDDRPYIRDLSHMVAAVIGWSYDDKRGGIRVGGCGMDMGFHTVYTLSRTLYRGVEKPEGVDSYSTDQGYWLKQSWL